MPLKKMTFPKVVRAASFHSFALSGSLRFVGSERIMQSRAVHLEGNASDKATQSKENASEAASLRHFPSSRWPG